MPPMEPDANESPLQQLLRRLPAVDHLLNQPAVATLLQDYARGEVLYAVRAVLDERRNALRAGQSVSVDVPDLALEIRERLYQRARPNLRRVINATGVVLHTGLGRAPLPEEALTALADVSAGYCNLELDLETGRRGNRHDHVRDALRELCGAEDALVVNNNAAATYLALHALAEGREVLIARGQLVEIGGSYRLPDIMAAAQCRMVEVGTTNRTRVGDYERAINDQTAVLLRVHTSNYRVVGFTESTPLADLVALARKHNLLVVDDLGSGLLVRGGLGDSDLGDEPGVPESLATGADLALFSGDKLLGGPQAGIIVGRADLITTLRKNPLARAFRPGKLTLAALEATLRLYRDADTVVQRVPALRYLARNAADLQRSAEELAAVLTQALPQATVAARPDQSEAGGGSLAAIAFPTTVVEVRVPNAAAETLTDELRRRDLPILCRVRDEALVFDPRTLEAEDFPQIAGALAEVCREL
jgi:L-seryl-tRNA(Ser) seleniumtransferase